MGIFKQIQISRGRCSGCGNWRDQCVCFEMEEHYAREKRLEKARQVMAEMRGALQMVADYFKGVDLDNGLDEVLSAVRGALCEYDKHEEHKAEGEQE